jgi:hypothetical protein
VHLHGWLYDLRKPDSKGAKFDSSRDRKVAVRLSSAAAGDPGWDEGVAGMKVGGQRTLIIPPDMGYGARGAGGVIPAERHADLRRRAARSEVAGRPMLPLMLPREGRPPTKRGRLSAAGVPGRHVAAAFDLDPEATEVTATLAFRRNPGRRRAGSRGAAGARRRAAGRGRRRDRRRPLASARMRITPTQMTIVDPPSSGVLTITSTIAPGTQRRARGPLPVLGRVLHAVRARGVPPHHVLPRTAPTSSRSSR